MRNLIQHAPAQPRKELLAAVQTGTTSLHEGLAGHMRNFQ